MGILDRLADHVIESEIHGRDEEAASRTVELEEAVGRRGAWLAINRARERRFPCLVAARKELAAGRAQS